MGGRSGVRPEGEHEMLVGLLTANARRCCDTPLVLLLLLPGAVCVIASEPVPDR